MSKSTAAVRETREAQAPDAAHDGPMLSGDTRAKFVLFAVPASERVDDGPVMRGLLETEQGKVNVAGWKRVARETGAEYLSLKVGNSKPRDASAPKDDGDEWLVGPFYGRLFKEVRSLRGATTTRYFGFIEDAVKVGVDAETSKGLYETRWQVQIRAKPNVSKDGKTPYIDGTVSPAATRAEQGEAALPF